MTKRAASSYSHAGPECPKCSFMFTVDEAHYYDEIRYTEDECPECRCKFTVNVSTSTSWDCTEILSADGECAGTKEDGK